MRFEEVLPEIRKGKKAKHSKMNPGEYWTACTAKITSALHNRVDEWESLVRMTINKSGVHHATDDGQYGWGISRWEIMDETWELLDE